MLDLIGVAVFPNRSRIGGIHRLAVVGMDAFEERLVGCGELLRLKAEDAVHLIRPDEPVVDQVQLPTAEMGDLLRPLEPSPRSGAAIPRLSYVW